MPANRRVDADCGAGGFCSPTWFSAFGRWRVDGYYCHTPMDQCRDDSDCTGQTIAGPTRCSYSVEAGVWSCFFRGAAG